LSDGATFRRGCATIEVQERLRRSIGFADRGHHSSGVSRVSVAIDFDHGANP
jgi:hypothetical protein